MAALSKSQVNKLGERLRVGEATESDLALLDQFRNSFLESYARVVAVVVGVLRIQPSGRAAKSVPSIIAKLRRDKGRLSEMQDIAGCRIVVADRYRQDAVVDALGLAFDQVVVTDRRSKPSHGYRAVHLIVTDSGRPVEIQIRTELQHLWAELSERWSDFLPGLKYGQGAGPDYDALDQLSDVIEALEQSEVDGTDMSWARSRLLEHIRSKIRDVATRLESEGDFSH